MVVAILIGSAYCFLISLGLSLSANRNTRTGNTVALFTTIGFLLLFSFLIQSNIARELLMIVQPVLMAVIAPLAYRFCQDSLDINVPFHPSFVVLPVVTLGANLTAFFFLSPESLRAVVYFCYLTSTLSLLGFQLFFLIRNFRFASFIASQPAIKVLFVLAMGSLAATSVMLVAALQKNLEIMRLASLLLTGSLIVFFSFVQRFPQLLTLQPSAGQSYANSKLRGVDLTTVGSRLEQLMVADRRYLDQDLTLGALAAELNLTSHQLSEYLNSHMRTGFSAYVQRYRIEEARVLLESENQLTLLEVAFRSGFRSKSAFNSAFREILGASPSEYRKQPDVHRKKA